MSVLHLILGTSHPIYPLHSTPVLHLTHLLSSPLQNQGKVAEPTNTHTDNSPSLPPSLSPSPTSTNTNTNTKALAPAPPRYGYNYGDGDGDGDGDGEVF